MISFGGHHISQQQIRKGNMGNAMADAMGP